MSHSYIIWLRYEPYTHTHSYTHTNTHTSLKNYRKANPYFKDKIQLLNMPGTYANDFSCYLQERLCFQNNSSNMVEFFFGRQYPTHLI